MVWDGLRPDMITPEYTPALHALGRRGVFFSNSHAVFPTVTRINAATMQTGVWPSKHGVPGNTFYAPQLDPRGVFNTARQDDLEALRAARDGRMLLRQTAAEWLSSAGGHTVVLSTGSPGSALLQHPQAEQCGDVMLHPTVLAGMERERLEHALGPMPDGALPNTEQNRYFARAIVDFVIPELAPDLLLFWHTDPDRTQHRQGLGDAESMASLRDADRNLQLMIDGLERNGVAAETDVIVLSDHGFATVRGGGDLAGELVRAGVKDSDDSTDVVVTEGFVYVPDGDPDRVRAVVSVVQHLETIGPIFTGARGAEVVEGTLPLEAIDADGEMAPDVMCSWNWSDDANEHGVRGTVSAPGTAAATHGSISPWEVRNSLIAAGPSFKQGLVSDIPVGNIDLTPTVLHLLGVQAGDVFDGRVLHEALNGGPAPSSVAVDSEELRSAADGFTQSLQRARVEGVTYVDHGRVERA